MAEIISQTNIVKVIKAQIKFSDKLLRVIMKGLAKGSPVLSMNLKKDMERAAENIRVLFGEDGIVGTCLRAATEIAKVEKLKRKPIKRAAKNIKRIIKFGKNIEKMIHKYKADQINLKPLDNILNSINSVADTMQKIKVFNLRSYLKLKWSLHNLRNSIYAIGDFYGFLCERSHFLKSLKQDFKFLLKTIKDIKSITEAIKNITENISNFRTRGLTKKIFKIKKILHPLQSLINRISWIRHTRRAMRKIMSIYTIMMMIGQLLTLFIIMVPLMVMFIIISPILIICFSAIMLVLRAIAFIIKHGINLKTILAIVILGLVLTALLVLALIILMLAEMSTLIIKHIFGLILFFIGLIVIVGLIALMGAIMSVSLVFLFAATIGVALVTSIIFMLVLCATFMLALQEIKLDKDKILNNVNTIIDIARSIIASIFTEDNKGEKSDKSWLGSLFSYVGSGLIMIIQAIMAVAFIALIFASITFILLIALELRLIQNLNLDKEKIQENVAMVIDIAKSVISSIWDQNDDKNNPSTRSIFKVVIEFFGGEQLGLIWDAIMSVAFLALTLISITLITLMAGELRVLQVIDLDSKKIDENIKTVIDTAFNVINSLWDPKDDKNNPSARGLLGIIISLFAGPEIIAIWQAAMAIAFLALTLVSITIINLIAAELRILQEIDLEPDTITTNVTTVIDTAHQVINSIWDPKDDKDNKSEKGFFRTLLDWAGLGQLAAIWDSMMQIAYLALIEGSIGLIVGIAKDLSMLTKVDFDSGIIVSNVQTILEVANKVVEEINKPDEKSAKQEDSIWSTLLGLFGYDEKYIKAMQSIGFVSMISSCVACVKKVAEDLKTIKDIELPEASIKAKVYKIISTASGIVNSLVTDYDNMVKSKGDWYEQAQFINDKKESVKSYVEWLTLYGTVLPPIKKLAADLKSLNGWNIEGASEAYIIGVKNILHITSEVIKATDLSIDGFSLGRAKSKLDSAVKIVSSLTKASGANENVRSSDLESRLIYVQKSVAEYMKFMDKINSMDITKLQSAEHLFEHISSFSKSINGNFNELAQTLNDKIAPLLQELKDILIKIPNKMDDVVAGTVRPEETPKFTVDKQGRTIIQESKDGQSTFISGDAQLDNSINEAQKRKDLIAAYNKQRNKSLTEEYVTLQEIIDILTMRGVYTRARPGII